MFRLMFYSPRIAPNTGNAIRMVAATGCELHLVEPLGFAWDDKRVRRAGLDYHEFAEVKRYPDLASCLATLGSGRLFACTTKGSTRPSDVAFAAGDILLFGPETRGLPMEVIESLPPDQRLRLPMLPQSRSMNLSNAVAVLVYESWRQLGYQGAK